MEKEIESLHSDHSVTLGREVSNSLEISLCRLVVFVANSKCFSFAEMVQEVTASLDL